MRELQANRLRPAYEAFATGCRLRDATEADRRFICAQAYLVLDRLGLREGEEALSVLELEPLCTGGAAAACRRQGDLQERLGRRNARDDRYDRACSLCDLEACARRAAEARDEPRASDWEARSRRACRLGDGPSCRAVATARDAVEHYARACDLGDAAACGSLGTVYLGSGTVLFGTGGRLVAERDPSRGRGLLARACALDSEWCPRHRESALSLAATTCDPSVR